MIGLFVGAVINALGLGGVYWALLQNNFTMACVLGGIGGLFTYLVGFVTGSHHMLAYLQGELAAGNSLEDVI